MKVWMTITLMFLFGVSVATATDNMKAFPPAEEGMVRYVLQLPKQTDESVFKMELIVGGLIGYQAATAKGQGLSASAHAADRPATGSNNHAGNQEQGCLIFMAGAWENFN